MKLKFTSVWSLFQFPSFLHPTYFATSICSHITITVPPIRNMDLCYKNQDTNIFSFFQMILFHCVALRGAASILETFGFGVEEVCRHCFEKKSLKGTNFKN